ncbi:MAG TPA: tail fiber protein [Solirubrobacteraceae bacterium]|nr:tail fiber protein [Solirubrobacteraceae bacterium]
MSDQYVGEIRLFGGNFAPEEWAPCDGRLLQISQYEVLFNLIGTIYGGDGQTTFAVPDLRGRLPLSTGQAPGQSNYTLGQKGGTEAVTLAAAQYPAHSHHLRASTALGGEASPAGGLLGSCAGTYLYHESAPTESLNQASIAPSRGGAQPHENRQPFLCVSYIIALNGLYPSQD